MKHVDLFSGIGGFTLAAHWAGFETVCFCEADDERRAFLQRRWPGIPIYDDINTFPAERYIGPAILTAGVPCQPVSLAGKRKGAADDRWLWPQALAAVSTIQPAWVLFENPPGIEGMGLAGIVAALEAEGYEVGVVDIPACAVSAPHIRHRYWIVAHSDSGRRQGGWKEGDCRISIQEQEDVRTEAEGGDSCSRACALADPNGVKRRSDGRQSNSKPNGGHNTPWSVAASIPCRDGKQRRTKPGIRLMAHGVSRGLLRALGDSIVPEVAYRIMAAIAELELRTNDQT